MKYFTFSLKNIIFMLKCYIQVFFYRKINHFLLHIVKVYLYCNYLAKSFNNYIFFIKFKNGFSLQFINFLMVPASNLTLRRYLFLSDLFRNLYHLLFRVYRVSVPISRYRYLFI